MSVVQMQKVRLLIHSTDVDAALDIVQKEGALEFRAVSLDDAVEPKIEFPNAQLLPRVEHAERFIAPYAKKVGLWQTLREGTLTTLSESDISHSLNDTDAVLSVVEDLEKLQVEFTDRNEEVRQQESMYRLFSDWINLPIKLSQLDTQRTSTLLLVANNSLQKKNLNDVLETYLNDSSIVGEVTNVTDAQVALTTLKGSCKNDAILKSVAGLGFEVVLLPEGKETPEIEIVAVSERLAALKGELAMLHDQAEHFAITHIKKLQIASEILSWQKNRYDVISAAAATKYLIVLEGWLNKSKKDLVESKFKAGNIAAVFSEIEPNEGESVPVDIENNAFFKPFELVTRLYGMPGHKDLDPTPFLAAFFFLFFGLSLTDVGYGLFLVAVSLIILTLFKVSESMRLFAKLLLFVGSATVFVGALFGGYLGFDPSFLPQSIQALQMFDPIGNPLPVFYLALGLGVVQVMAGMILKIYSEHKNGRVLEGVMDQGPWLFMFVMAIVYLGTVLDYVSLLSVEQIINLFYVGLVMIVIASGRKGETVLIKIKDSAAGLYDSIGYFSDILSYSRLLALGLATTALAFAVNMIAEMVVDVPYVGYLLAGLILLVGHLFTLAVNTLGAFIHSARLQFVEFFGKFIVETGKEFSPLSRTEKHVTVTDD